MHGERSGIGYDLTSLANASGRSKCSLLGGFCLLSFVLFILSGVLLRPYSVILVFLDLCVHRNVHLRRIRRRRPRAPGTPRPLPRPRESPGKVLPCAGLGKKEEDWRRGRLRVGVGGLRAAGSPRRRAAARTRGRRRRSEGLPLPGEGEGGGFLRSSSIFRRNEIMKAGRAARLRQGRAGGVAGAAAARVQKGRADLQGRRACRSRCPGGEEGGGRRRRGSAALC